MAMRFQNKVALVTGGASGIGKEVATRFVTEGGSVVINGRDRAKAEAVAREVDEAEYDRFLGIILKGKFFAAQAAAKAMKESGRGGAIVQTGSMWALQAIGATPS